MGHAGTLDWIKAGALLYLARVHDLAGRRESALRLYRRIANEFKSEPAAQAARLGLLAPYRRLAAMPLTGRAGGPSADIRRDRVIYKL